MEPQIEGTEKLLELQETLKELTKKYPDRAGELLKEDAKQLRKKIATEFKQKTNTSNSRKSLGRAGSYKISPVLGLGTKQYVEISAKSPHFHLVEHGHELVNGNGEKVGKGYVEGKHILDNEVKKHQNEFEDVVSGMIDTLLKENGLI